MTKKLMLLAMAVAAVVAFAVPALASADMYKDNGNEISGSIVVSYAGTAQFTTHIPGETQFGVHCNVTAEVEIETNAARVTSFLGGGCTGLDGFSECEVETLGVPGLAIGAETPWAIDAETSEDLNITGVNARNGFAEGCAAPGAFVEGTVTATPAVAGNLEHLTLSGEVASPFGANTATVSGTITSENPSTVITFEP
jgi:hypothetical protein